MDLSINDGGIRPWARFAENRDSWYMQLLKGVAKETGFTLDTPLKDLPKRALEAILEGTGEKTYKVKSQSGPGAWNGHFEGLIPT